MTREEAKEKIFCQWQDFLEHNLDYAGISEAYKMAIKALEQEPCEDAISRQAVMNCIDGYSQMIIRPLELKGYIDDLQPVTPKQKTGHWIEDDFTGIIKCSICDNDAPISTTSGEQYCSNYCPNCGVKMVEPQESEDKE